MMISNLQIPRYWDTLVAVDEDFHVNMNDIVHDAFSTDHFRMFQFKIRKCPRGRSHDWTDCPYAHPGEKARRRDPLKHHYSGTACPDFRKGNCHRGDTCHLAHGVFECWLHPSRYRTQMCKDGTCCRRRVCFFAHTAEQLRVLLTTPSNSGILEMVSSMRNVKLDDVACYGWSGPPVTVRVELGREIRARIYDKLNRENSIGSVAPVPDIGWVCELVK
ncbi:hypothetical protein RIF29_12599 [Crotalaria pallida]|uniref:C3H1-type domain-containing protein n=1 Tax=Crotalaria pallida TaxID=3830 RepID=A0AAN9P284_CROPI